MAIRIDLLPSYVGLKRWFKRIAAVCALLVVGFMAVLYLLYYKDQLKLKTLQTNRDNIKQYADKADTAKSAADAATTKAKPFQDAVSFMVDAGRTGAERAALLDLVRRYVYANAVVGAIDLSDGQNAKMTVLVRNPDEYAKFLLNLRRGTTPTGVLFADLPSGSGISGWPNVSGGAGAGGGDIAATPTAGGAPGAGGNQTAGDKDTDPNVLMQKIFNNKIDINAKLREPVVIPSPPGGAAAPAAGAGVGGPGMPGDPGMPPGADLPAPPGPPAA